MQEFLTTRQSAQDYEAALLLQAQFVSKAWKRFGAQLLASLAAFTLTFATIGGAIVTPIDHTPVAAQDKAPDGELHLPLLRGPLL